VNIFPLAVTIAILIICSMIWVQSNYIIDQGRRLKQLEAAMAVYMKEIK
jgi:hypothetical protein